MQSGLNRFLPAGTSYQLVNFEAKPIKCVFAITKL
jgi:gentisate 1,2-dioxygenase